YGNHSKSDNAADDEHHRRHSDAGYNGAVSTDRGGARNAGRFASGRKCDLHDNGDASGKARRLHCEIPLRRWPIHSAQRRARKSACTIDQYHSHAYTKMIRAIATVLSVSFLITARPQTSLRFAVTTSLPAASGRLLIV